MLQGIIKGHIAMGLLPGPNKKKLSYNLIKCTKGVNISFCALSSPFSMCFLLKRILFMPHEEVIQVFCSPCRDDEHSHSAKREHQKMHLQIGSQQVSTAGNHPALESVLFWHSAITMRDMKDIPSLC